MPLYHTLVSSSFGDWAITDDGAHIIGFDYWPDLALCDDSSALGKEARAQVLAYLDAPDFQFELPLNPQGTEFQQRVWQQMLAIKRGETLTYGEVANLLGSAARAVGGACRANPIPLIIPCHRIIGKQSLGGFSGQTQGQTLTLKERLLRHEGAL